MVDTSQETSVLGGLAGARSVSAEAAILAQVCAPGESGGSGRDFQRSN